MAVPPPPPALCPPPPPPPRGLVLTVGAGALILAAAAASFARKLISGRQRRPAAPHAPLSPEAAAAAGAMGPLLLAAQTAATVDETDTLTPEALRELELTVRALITNIDSQLLELQEALAAGLPPAAAQALDAALEAAASSEEIEEGSFMDAVQAEQAALAAQWEVFCVLQPHAPEDDRRRYRSLLYNRSVQRQLLAQVERQLATRERARLRAEMEAVQARMAALQEAVAGEAAPAEGGGQPATSLRLAAAGACVPHPAKASTGGEDAHYVSARYAAFGVADGVGGWAAQGIDPSVYPRLLMAVAERVSGEHAYPMDTLRAAHAAAHAPGSCTVALASVQGGALRVASLGDCGVRVVRGGAVEFASEVQEHSFNRPLQLASERHHPGASAPGEARQYEVPLQAGDAIIMGSDGLFDNLWDWEMLDLVARAGLDDAFAAGAPLAAMQAAAARLAESLAAAAARNAGDRRYRSPFSHERHERMAPPLMRAMLRAPPGGKLDDVTCVVGLVR